jgi:hypothetical protein
MSLEERKLEIIDDFARLWERKGLAYKTVSYPWWVNRLRQVHTMLGLWVYRLELKHAKFGPWESKP